MSIRKAIRKYCLWCCNNQKNEVLLCPDKSCSLWGYRTSTTKEHKLSSLKAIKARCRDCLPEGRNSVKNCEDIECALHPYRLGKNPFRKKRIYSEEEKRALRERLNKAREYGF